MVAAVGIQGAGFERRAENCGGLFRPWRLEFAQGVHRLRTVLSSQFSVGSVRLWKRRASFARRRVILQRVSCLGSLSREAFAAHLGDDRNE